MIKAAPAPSNTLLSPNNHVLMMMTIMSNGFCGESIDP